MISKIIREIEEKRILLIAASVALPGYILLLMLLEEVCDDLFSYMFYLPSLVGIFGLLFLLIVEIVIVLKDMRKLRSYVPLLVLICMLFLLSKIDYKAWRISIVKSKRMQIIELLHNHELGDATENRVTLPLKYRIYSQSGKVVEIMNSQENCVVGFYTYRGLMSEGFRITAYSEKEISSEELNELFLNINEYYRDFYYNIEEVIPHWYSVHAREIQMRNS